MYAPLYPYFSPPPKMARTISSTSEDRTEGYEFLVRALRAFPAGREWCPALFRERACSFAGRTVSRKIPGPVAFFFGRPADRFSFPD